MKKKQTQSSMIVGLVLITLGVIFLVSRVLNIHIGENLWPFAIIGFGGLLLAVMLLGDSSIGWLAVPACMTITTGLVLLVQNTINRFESWAYAWAMVLAAYGVGMVINGYKNGLSEIRQNGWSLARLGMLLFLLLGGFFEIFIFQRKIDVIGIVWPVALILIGVGIFASDFVTKLINQKA